jgi:hypothetical protein
VGQDGSGTFSFTFNTEQACSPSGNVAVAGALSGSFNGLAQTADLQANLGLTHHACSVATGGGTVLLNGDPRIDVTLHASGGPAGASELHVTETGGFAWQKSDGSAGHCALNVTADLVPGTQTVKLAGTFCGWPVDQTVPLGS